MKDFVDLLYAVAIVFIFIAVITAAVSFGFLVVPLFFIILLIIGVLTIIKQNK